MRVGSLFSGIGGLDLGLERAGMTVVWQSEIDPYACRVLAKHWPHVPNLGDITTVDWSTVERPDLICGGYPCQPFSLAGVRRGESDPRHLWPHFARALRVLRPRWALLENVPGHLSLGFGRVLGDLAELGYDADWDCIPAAAVGAPHLRYRVFVVAHAMRGRQSAIVRGSRTADGSRSPEGSSYGGSTLSDAVSGELRLEPVGIGRGGGQTVARNDGEDRDVADPNGPPRASADAGRGIGPSPLLRREAPGSGRRREGTDGGGWAVEPDVGRVAHGVPDRVDRLRCLGNAVVPQVAEWIGHRIMEVAA